MSDLRFISVTANPGGADPRLVLATPSGRIRDVPLTTEQLATLLADAAQLSARQLKTLAAFAGQS